MADFSKPTVLSDYSAVLDELKANIEATAKMFDGTIDQNVPIGAIRYSSTTKQLEKWNGTAWIGLQISGTSDVSGTALANDSVSGQKILLNNTQYLRGASTGGGALNLLRVNASNETELNASSGTALIFSQSSAKKWAFTGQTFDFVPVLNDTLSIGAQSGRLKEVHAKTVKGLDSVENGFGALHVGTTTLFPTYLRAANSSFISLHSAGIAGAKKMIPEHPAVSLGDAANAWQLVSTQRLLAQTIENLAGGGLLVLNDSDSYLTLRSGSTTPAEWRVYWGPGSSLLPAKDLQQDLGSPTSRVRTLYAGQVLACQTVYGGVTKLTIDSANYDLLLRSNNREWGIPASSGAFSPLVDASFDLGASDRRVRTIYTQQLICSGLTRPTANNLFDLGTNELRFRNTYSQLVYTTYVTAPGRESLWLVQDGIYRLGWNPGDTRPHFENVEITQGNWVFDGWLRVVVNGQDRVIALHRGA